MQLNVCNLGQLDYLKTFAIQNVLHTLRQQGEIEDTLLLVEHPPALTTGRSGGRSNILVSDHVLQDMGIRIHDVDRGGDVTYHGPGQLVGYPILDLDGHGRDVREYVWKVQEAIILMLRQRYGVDADRGPYTGVWVADDKIAAIGIAIRRWVTMHGFALNVNTNLEHFSWIVPCGITNKGVTSLRKITGLSLSMEEVAALAIRYFCEVFGMHPVTKDIRQVASACVL